MSLEILDQLEEKIRQAVETIQLLQLEVEELKEQKSTKRGPFAGTNGPISFRDLFHSPFHVNVHGS